MWLNKRNSTWRRLSALIITAVLAAVVTACGGGNGDGGRQADDEGQAVATYKGGGVVTDTEFNKYITMLELTNPTEALYMEYIPEYKEEQLKRYIIYKEYAAQATGEETKQAEESAASFRDQLDTLLKDKEQKEAIQEILDKSGFTSLDAERILKMLVSAELVIERKHNEFLDAVTEDEIRAEFEKLPSDFNIVSVRHILVATHDSATGEQLRTPEEAMARAKEAKAKLEAGGDWQALAEEYSDDPGSKNNGGLYENVEAGNWVEAFKQAANTQPIGMIGDPVQTEYGYHVMKVEKREEMTFDKLTEEKKDRIRSSIADPRLNEFMQQEIEALEIEIKLPKQETPAGEGEEAGAGTDADAGAGGE